MRKMFFCCKKILLILNNQKMKNLQELSLNELREIEGGFPPVVLAAWAIMATIDVALIAIYADQQKK
jgi:hypothetical protein